MKKLRITVDGRVFEVTVETTDDGAPVAPQPVFAPASVAAPAQTPVLAPVRAAPVAGQGAVCSPLAGKVVSIDVAVGVTVAAGAQVATIEAMKMNTFIYAEKAGQVLAVVVKPGDAVEEGGVLLTVG
jgi:biotin carboxyl carrier protein